MELGYVMDKKYNCSAHVSQAWVNRENICKRRGPHDAQKTISPVSVPDLFKSGDSRPNNVIGILNVQHWPETEIIFYSIRARQMILK